MKTQRSVGILYSLFAAGLFALAGCAGTAHKESTGEVIDDSVITAKVKTALIDNREVQARNIHVETFKGTVHLTGTAATAHESWKAADLARHVNGVRAVRNEIAVR